METLEQAVNEVLSNECLDLTPIYSWQIDNDITDENLVEALRNIYIYSITASLPGCLPDYREDYLCKYDEAKRIFIDELIERTFELADDEGELPDNLNDELKADLDYFRERPYRADLGAILPNSYVFRLTEHTADEMLSW